MSVHDEFRVIHVSTVAPTRVKFTSSLKLLGFEAYKDGLPGYKILHYSRSTQELEFEVTLEAVSEGGTWDRDKMKPLGCFITNDGKPKIILQHIEHVAKVLPPSPQDIVDLMERSIEQAGQSSEDAVKVMHKLIKHYDHLSDAQRKQLSDMTNDKMFLKEMIDLDVTHEQFLQNLAAVLFVGSAGRLTYQMRDKLRQFSQ